MGVSAVFVMILIDTSAWIEFFRRKGNPLVKQRIATLITANEAAYSCPVVFELISGALDQELPAISKGLSFATRIQLSPSDWDMAAHSARTLRKAGVTVPPDDLLIATVGFERSIPIMCRDKHFSMIQSNVYSELKLENIL